jgi:hypothetical protein
VATPIDPDQAAQTAAIVDKLAKALTSASQQLSNVLSATNSVGGSMDNIVGKTEKFIELNTEIEAGLENLKKQYGLIGSELEQTLEQTEKDLQKQYETLKQHTVDIAALESQRVGDKSKEVEIDEEINRIKRERIVLTQEEIMRLQKKRLLEKDILTLDKAMDNQVASLAQRFLGVTDASNSWLAVMDRVYKNGDKGMASLSSAAMDLGGKFIKFVTNPLNIAMSLISKVFESTYVNVKRLDEALGNFGKRTNMMEEFADRIAYAGTRFAYLGVTFESAASTIDKLFSGMQGFAGLSADQQALLEDTVNLAQQAGQSADDTVKFFDTAMNALNLSDKQARRLMDNYRGFAKALGIPINQMLSDFNRATPELMKHGKNMEGVFKGLVGISKAASVSIGELMSTFGAQFDTFEGSASAIGKLNALLGGPYLNTLEFMKASESDRALMAVEAFQATGKQFGQLDKFNQKVIASSLGIKDMAFANKLFSMNTIQARMEMMKQSIEAKSLEEQAKKNAKIMEMLTGLFVDFGMAMMPILTATKQLLGFLNSVSVAMKNFSGGIVNVTDLLMLLGIAMTTGPVRAILIFIEGFKLATQFMAKFTDASSTFGQVVGTVFGVIAVVALGKFAIAAGGAALGALGLSKGLSTSAPAIGASLAEIGTGAAVAVPGMLAFAAAVASVGVAAAGIGYLIHGDEPKMPATASDEAMFLTQISESKVSLVSTLATHMERLSAAINAISSAKLEELSDMMGMAAITGTVFGTLAAFVGEAGVEGKAPAKSEAAITRTEIENIIVQQTDTVREIKVITENLTQVTSDMSKNMGPGQGDSASRASLVLKLDTETVAEALVEHWSRRGWTLKQTSR